MKDLAKGYITPNRLTGLSDAIFAIVLTLLILDLKLETPEGMTDAELWSHLVGLYPLVIAYTLTFFLVAKYWQLHTVVFDKKKNINATILVLNLSFLLSISFLPLPSGLLGTNYTQLSLLIFNFSISVPAIFLYFVAKELEKVNPVDGELSDEQISFSDQFTVSLLIIPVAAVISVIISFFYVRWALIGWAFLLIKKFLLKKETSS